MGLEDRPAERRKRARMVRDQLVDCRDERVRQAMAELPRHAFVPEDFAAGAYGDHAMGIGAGQTISQPRVVGFMLERLAVPRGGNVLDVGSGSGYVSALLARLVAERGIVHAVERQAALVAQARAPLARYTGGGDVAPVVQHLSDGADGLPEHAPFDRIHVACACPELPAALVDQLAPEGRMVLPIGATSDLQYIVLVCKDERGRVAQERLWPVRFVPLLAGTTGAAGGDAEEGE